MKTRGEETLNRSWAESNLYMLSPISPDGQVTPLTNYTGASVSDPCVSFDGERIDHWRGFRKDAMPEGWVVEDGCIHRNGHGGDA